VNLNDEFKWICVNLYEFIRIAKFSFEYLHMNLNEFIWIYVNYKYEFFILVLVLVNLHESKEFVGQSIKRSERQCVAVRTAVCVQSAWQCAAVFLVVYGSAHGSVRLSGSVR
jgi:hypothetical protein